MIHGVKVIPLSIIKDHRGSVRHFLRSDDPHFDGEFGEVYFSEAHPGYVKAWHIHSKMTLRYVCVHGVVLVGLYDSRPESPTAGVCERLTLSDRGPDYKLLIIPPNVWNGFRVPERVNMSSIIANCASHPHDPDEIHRVHPEDFGVPFDWGNYKAAG